MNRENLKKLADGLRSNLVVPFNMGCFVSGVETQHDVTRVGNGCGTAACACGHATYLVESKLRHEDFFAYSERVFGVTRAAMGGSFDWCFGGCWREVDNSPQGAAGRIDWMLEHGVPVNCFDQQTGHAPLCYRTTP